ncbi:MAG: Eco57I restriction-modification methylase domain-containing protein [Planctomycetes bacterium]|nr:Eco57I restriction-modification methylase domain-containing protein [Planctomycetota bacterium]
MPSAPENVVKLVERFDRNAENYKSPAFNETELRVELVNPLWKALGWDMDNEAGNAMAYRDVIHEDAIRVGASTKAPDYCFRIGGMRKFFLETKKPAVNLKTDPSPAYQLRRYGWSAKLPVSVLTDFEEMAVYDCRIRPKASDKASVGRMTYYNYSEYLDRWDEIAGVFSRGAVLKGSFDKYVDSTRGKRGASEVDEEFLKEIERWRDLLAKDLALHNPSLDVRGLNFAVGKTIDRIIFLRMCEDRGIEMYGQLLALSGGARIYPRLVEIYRRADEKYNSGLFHFNEEKDRIEAPDTLTPRVKIDDKPLREILSRLYYPESPYEFSILPTEILGNVYEQFLGKVIRLTAGHHAKIEEKPEVRKAGGVYYTPAYIVEYIVKNTVGRLCEGKTPREVSKFTILDPACGSGSFLLGAYQYLLDWHLGWYTDEMRKTGGAPKSPPAEGKRQRKGDPNAIYETRRGWLLTTAEKKRILLNNLYGVDIDAQAVEVTKLSLLLKVLENENAETLKNQLTLWRERALPDLADNIKCGNSLIGPDFYTQPRQGELFADEETRRRVNVFDWKDAEHGFGEILKSGGFDIVLGNPPYIRIQAMKEWAPIEVEHCKKTYSVAAKGNYDIYVVFIEKGLELLKPRGRLGYICPNKFFNAQYGEALRRLIAGGRHLADVIHFGDNQVFAGAMTYTCLLFLEKIGVPDCRFLRVKDLEAWRLAQAGGAKDTTQAPAAFDEGRVLAGELTPSEWHFAVGPAAKVMERLNRVPTRLGHVAGRIFQGLITGADPVFLLTSAGDGRVRSDALDGEIRLEVDLLHPVCKGAVDIRRWRVDRLQKQILFPYFVRDDRAELIPPGEMSKKYPRTWSYLLKNREILEARERGKWKHDRWYAFGRSQNLTEMDQPKILTPSIARVASFAYDDRGDYYFVGSGGGGGGGYGITLRADVSLDHRYVLGLLNSRALDFFVKATSSPFSGGYYAFNRQYIERLPIRSIDPSKAEDRKMHDNLVQLVQAMLDLQKRSPLAQTPDAEASLSRDIVALDRQIDALVYVLYELTGEEIAIVEAEMRD